MNIDPNTKLSAIQTEFSRQFPHLRLEFYRSRHDAGEGSADKEKLNADQTLAQIGLGGSSGSLPLDEHLKISEFERMLMHQLGLNVQVFRRSGNLWLQTTTTDTWSLGEANRKGGHSRELFGQQAPDLE